MVGSSAPLPDRGQFHEAFLEASSQIEAALNLVTSEHQDALGRSLRRSKEWQPGHSVSSTFESAVQTAAEVEGAADRSGDTAAAFVAHAAVELAASARAAAMMENALAGGAAMGAWENYRTAQALLGMARASVAVARLLTADTQISPPPGGWKLLLRRYDFPGDQALAFAQELAGSLGSPRPWRLGKIHPRLVGPVLAWVTLGNEPPGVLPSLPAPAVRDQPARSGTSEPHDTDSEHDEELAAEGGGIDEATEERMDELATALATRIRSEDPREISGVTVHVTASDITLGSVRDDQRQEVDVRWGMRLLQPEVSELSDLVGRSFDIAFTEGGAYCFPHEEEDALARLLADRIRDGCPAASSVDVYVTPTELQVSGVHDEELEDLEVDWGIRLLLPEVQRLAEVVGSSFTLYIEDDGAAYCVPDDSLEAGPATTTTHPPKFNRRPDSPLRAQPSSGESRSVTPDHVGGDGDHASDRRIDELIRQLGGRITALGPPGISTVVISSTGQEGWVSGVSVRVPSDDDDDYDDAEDVDVDWNIRDLRPMVTELLGLIRGSFAVHFSRDGTASRGTVL